MQRALISSFAAAVAALAFGFAGSAASARAPAGAGVGALCSGVMRLEAGQAQFDSCVASLSDSLGRLQESRGAVAAREACAAQGLKAGTPDLALCTLNGARAAPSAAVTLASAPAAGGKSYFYASSAERHGREQEACARLGLDPTSPAFDSCVAGLASALFAADNPSN